MKYLHLTDAVRLSLVSLFLFFVSAGPVAATPLQATLYHNPGCMCCEQYAEHLNEKGYDVKIVENAALASVNRQHAVRRQLSSCHTSLIGDYVVVGHIPEPVIAQLLRERPDIRGISLPGMPTGSPGMPGQQKEPFAIRTLAGEIYATY
ncbi:hypothetical protein T35B1_15416 [Salinisphaera shabanensis T35B1]|jgi:hypothetical protein|uniref:Exported protein n=1 Tax=Salinisphaera shabanensis E1L3A TaxID=1033802 RepID=U2EHM2_9GAMM|nr:DUF411 domain-containing protein [Salinisphaera shabanensis]ERJ17882.1 Putative exported protein [Salinisphaera shabanensis E1L3A]|tara:strand:- start:1194 stop:1640 length:447 start_codon:yes stop_codon:yes gene_type:complete